MNHRIFPNFTFIFVVLFVFVFFEPLKIVVILLFWDSVSTYNNNLAFDSNVLKFIRSLKRILLDIVYSV